MEANSASPLCLTVYLSPYNLEGTSTHSGTGGAFAGYRSDSAS